MNPLELELRLYRVENMLGVIVQLIDHLSDNTRATSFWQETRDDIINIYPQSGIAPPR